MFRAILVQSTGSSFVKKVEDTEGS